MLNIVSTTRRYTNDQSGREPLDAPLPPIPAIRYKRSDLDGDPSTVSPAPAPTPPPPPKTLPARKRGRPPRHSLYVSPPGSPGLDTQVADVVRNSVPAMVRNSLPEPRV